MTAYVLLALLSGPPVPGFDLEYASGIVRWLTQQQNPYGGFASTQVRQHTPAREDIYILNPFFYFYLLLFRFHVI